MLPPDFAAFGFTLDPAGGDAAVAERTGAALRTHGGRSVLVVGAQRWALVADLARRGLDVVAVDASRAVLGIAKRALEDAGVAARVTLFATDPRDAEVPGGADAALLTSAAWRTLLHAPAQRLVLQSLRRALRGPSLLLLDLDRVPPLPASGRLPLRDGPGRGAWWAERGPLGVRIGCTAPGVPEIPLDLSPMQPEEALGEVRAAAYDVVAADDAAGGPLGPASARMWLVARKASA